MNGTLFDVLSLQSDRMSIIYFPRCFFFTFNKWGTRNVIAIRTQFLCYKSMDTFALRKWCESHCQLTHLCPALFQFDIQTLVAVCTKDILRTGAQALNDLTKKMGKKRV